MNVQYYQIESEHTNLMITPGEKRRWIGISGHNIPSFELFLSPDWRGTDGVYFADQPSYRTGNYVKDVSIIFKKGRAVNITAKIGEEFVKKQLAMDKGASRLGEFSLTDKRFSKITGGHKGTSDGKWKTVPNHFGYEPSNVGSLPQDVGK